jgi:hypothetical protein
LSANIAPKVTSSKSLEPKDRKASQNNDRLFIIPEMIYSAKALPRRGVETALSITK